MHSISLQYSEKELLYSLNKTDIATFVIQLYSVFSKTNLLQNTEQNSKRKAVNFSESNL